MKSVPFRPISEGVVKRSPGEYFRSRTMISRSTTADKVFSMKVWCLVLLALLGYFPVGLHAGEPGDDKCSPGQSEAGESRSPIREDGFKDLPLRILEDQKIIWIEPFRVNSRRDLFLRAAIVGASAGSLFLDRPVGQELSDTPPGDLYRFSDQVRKYSGGLADFGVAGAFYLTGKLSGNERARTTGLLGIRAVTDAYFVVEVLKTVTRRPRPTLTGGILRNHNADGEFFTGGRSFPSGHSTQAWALATVVAHQYSNKRWVPPTAYGLAGFVAVARVTNREHFPTDIFVGSLMGYLIGRQVFRSNQKRLGRKGGNWQLGPSVTPDGGVGLSLRWKF